VVTTVTTAVGTTATTAVGTIDRLSHYALFFSHHSNIHGQPFPVRIHNGQPFSDDDLLLPRYSADLFAFFLRDKAHRSLYEAGNEPGLVPFSDAYRCAVRAFRQENVLCFRSLSSSGKVEVSPSRNDLFSGESVDCCSLRSLGCVKVCPVFNTVSMAKKHFYVFLNQILSQI